MSEKADLLAGFVLAFGLNVLFGLLLALKLRMISVQRQELLRLRREIHGDKDSS